MGEKKLEGAGLRGQVAGNTSLSTVGKTGKGLTYRGYAIEKLAEKATFEEVAYMLLYGHLPNQAEYNDYSQKLKSFRSLPDALKEVLERIPKNTHPMDVMRTGCSMLGNLEPEGDFENQNNTADRILASMSSIITYWYRFTHEGVRVDTATDHDTIGGQFLSLLTGKEPSEEHARALDVSLILYAEHGFNASTFTARTCASTLSDMHSCVTGAIGTLRGPLHGGANEAAMEMIEEIRRQFREIPGLMEGTADPDSAKCVDIATTAALRRMLAPGIIAVAVPIVVGFGLGAEALGGCLGGALLGCVLLALTMANAGGAWDNAKKYVEKGNLGGKGSDVHAATVVGDTVGDPFKDTSGPAMNILINVMAIVSLVIAPVLS